MILLKKLQEHLQAIVIGVISGVLTSITIYLLKFPFLNILKAISNEVSKQYILKVLSIFLLSILILVALTIYLLYKLRTKLYPRFGVFWDKSHSPYCPNTDCHTLLSGCAQDKAELICSKCKTPILILNDKGQVSTLERAIRKFKKGK